jgi:hypothetical protein
MSPPPPGTIAPPPYLLLAIKDLLKEDMEAFWMGVFSMKGGLLKGNELLKENCQRGIAKGELPKGNC